VGRPPKHYTAHNKTQTLKEWAKELGVSIATLRARLYNRLPRDKVFTSVKRGRTAKLALTYGGFRLTYREWAAKMKISETTIRARIHRGWTVKDALTIPVGEERPTIEGEGDDDTADSGDREE